MTTLHNNATGPHAGQPILTAGEPLAQAQAAMVLTHGRGAGAYDILSMKNLFADTSDFAFLAPHAFRSTWYPLSFLAPWEKNEPHLSSALAVLADVLQQLETAGIPPEKTILLGFSQGACLSLEFVARNPRRYGGVAALSGGLIGSEEASRDYPGSLAGTPVFLGCSDVDFHIPMERVQESTQVMQAMGAETTERLYPGMGHTVNQDEVDFVDNMMAVLRSA